MHISFTSDVRVAFNTPQNFPALRAGSFPALKIGYDCGELQGTAGNLQKVFLSIFLSSNNVLGALWSFPARKIAYDCGGNLQSSHKQF